MLQKSKISYSWADVPVADAYNSARISPMYNKIIHSNTTNLETVAHANRIIQFVDVQQGHK